MQSDMDRLNDEIVACRKCPRLVRWRQQCAIAPPRRYRGMKYWARPLPSFGAAQARLLIVGLAPAAHGGNRTGRMFTGDRSGDWLYGALHNAGFANQPNSYHSADGLKLSDCYITAAVHCAPPANKPSYAEFKRCRAYLIRELRLCTSVRVVIALGKIAFDAFIAAYRENGGTVPKPLPKFGHGVAVELAHGLKLLCSYHPSQQNTFTGKLTAPMFHAIFQRARAAL
jgi:uracil-DNA glycosylase family 4